MTVHQGGDAAREASDLRLATGRLARQLRLLYTRAKPDGVTFLELAVLSRIDRSGGLTPTELAGAERVTSQAIAGVVRSLEERGLVLRSAHPKDRRSVVVGITATGRDALTGRERTSIDAIADVIAHDLTAAERRRLSAAVPLLGRLAEQLADRLTEPVAPRQQWR